MPDSTGSPVWSVVVGFQASSGLLEPHHGTGTTTVLSRTRGASAHQSASTATASPTQAHTMFGSARA
jgi:hypothetical protein